MINETIQSNQFFCLHTNQIYLITFQNNIDKPQQPQKNARLDVR